MTKYLLLDRTQAAQTLYPLLTKNVDHDKQDLAFLALCQSYQMIYVEEIGASGLEKALREHRANLPSVSLIPRFVDLQLTNQEKTILKGVISSPDEEVVNALRQLQQEKGGRPRERDEILGYATRLVLLARVLGADLLCWQPRANVILALLGVPTVPTDDARDKYLRCAGDMAKLVPSFKGSLDVLFSPTVTPDPPRANIRGPRLSTKPNTILFLAANPHGTDRLALDHEARAIQVELERSGYRDCFNFETRWAIEPLDLLRELLVLRPTVIHFSGHGGEVVGDYLSESASHRDADENKQHSEQQSNERSGLCVQGSDGRAQLVTIAAFKQTLGAVRSSVKLVVLNACYSDIQADALLEHVLCVVGMDGSIHDEAARAFAIGFYRGLGECESIAAAYAQGRAAISLLGLPDGERPQLKARSGIDANQLVLAANARSFDDN